METVEEKKEDAAATEVENDDFTAVFDEDSDYNVKLWRALAGPRASLPKKGRLVVYFPQGHLEYAKSIPSFPYTQVPTFRLQPQIVCRVVHVQLIANKKNDEICAHVTLLPEPEKNSKSKELVESDEDEDEEECGGSPTESIPHFSKTLRFSDTRTLSVPSEAAKIFLAQDHNWPGFPRKVVAKDFLQMEWRFGLKVQGQEMNHQLISGWRKFVCKKNLLTGDKVVFLRDEDQKLRLGIRRVGHYEIGVPDSIIAKHYQYPYILAPVADAICHKRMFHVFYSSRASDADFIIPYQKYMKSITRPVLIGAEFQMRYEIDDSSQRRCSGIVTGMADLDTYRWPNSKWRCLMVKRVEGIEKNHKRQVSPWEIVPSSSSSPKLKRLRTSAQDAFKIHSSPKLKRLRTSAQDASPDNADPDSQAQVNESQLNAGDTAHHSLNLTKQSSSPHRFLPLTHSADKNLGVTTGETLEEYLEIDSCPSKASLLKRKSATSSVKQLKICKCEDLGFLLDLMVHNSLEYLEFDSCLFHPPPLLIHFPVTLKKLKITNCVNSEHVLAGLVDQKGLSLESLEIDSCSSLLSFPIDKLPATLRQLKIVSCMNLKLFSQLSEIKNHDSVSFGLGGDSSLPNITSTSTLELRELVIWDCEELHSLPEGLHNLTHLELLSLSNCSSLMYFPEGGLPNTCLKSLLISECDNLRSLPNQLHMVTSLQNLTVCGCPCLMSFPNGGLPPNLVSLRVIDCENLISLSYWDLHNLIHLKKYSFIGGCPDLGE